MPNLVSIVAYTLSSFRQETAQVTLRKPTDASETTKFIARQFKFHQYCIISRSVVLDRHNCIGVLSDTVDSQMMPFWGSPNLTPVNYLPFLLR